MGSALPSEKTGSGETLIAIDQLIAARAQSTEPAWLQNLRAKNRAALAAKGLPGKRWESWHYSAANLWLQQFNEKADLAPIAALSQTAAANAIFASTTTLRFSHGQLVDQQIDAADRDALTLLPLAELDQKHHADIIEWLTAHPHSDSFASLATALAPQSWVLIVRAESNLAQPIVISHLTSQSGAQIGQLIIWVEANAQATLLETFDGADELSSLHIAHTQLRMERGAKLTYARLNRDNLGTKHLGVIEGDIQRDAQLRVQVLRGGNTAETPNQKQRNGLYIRLQDKGAEFTARGAFAAAGAQHIDYHFTVDHNADHGRSDVQMQAIAGDKSRGVINGRIYIAEKTRANDGHFTSHNLLVSNDAEIDAKPELEIYADEVRCDHGATVGQLDEDQLLYLQTRGIDRVAAIALLTEGFLKAGLLDSGNSALDDYLQAQLLASIGGSAA